VRARHTVRTRGRPEGAEGAVVPRIYPENVTPSFPLFGGVSRYPKPEPLDMDAHPSFEVGVTLKGQVERHHQDFVYVADPGEIWLNAAWEPHGWRITQPKTSTLTVQVHPSLLGDETISGIPWLALFAVPPSERPRATNREARKQVLAIAEEIAEEFAGRTSAWEDAVRLGVLRILLRIGRQWQPRHLEGGSGLIPASNLTRLMPAIELVQSDLTRQVSISEAAQGCGMSPSHFRMVFRQTLGAPFGNWSLRRRLGVAARELLDGNSSVEKIALKCGFSSRSHLSRLFRKCYGRSPGRYRERAARSAAPDAGPEARD